MWSIVSGHTVGTNRIIFYFALKNETHQLFLNDFHRTQNISRKEGSPIQSYQGGCYISSASEVGQ